MKSSNKSSRMTSIGDAYLTGRMSQIERKVHIYNPIQIVLQYSYVTLLIVPIKCNSKSCSFVLMPVLFSVKDTIVVRMQQHQTLPPTLSIVSEKIDSGWDEWLYTRKPAKRFLVGRVELIYIIINLLNNAHLQVTLNIATTPPKNECEGRNIFTSLAVYCF